MTLSRLDTCIPACCLFGALCLFGARPVAAQTDGSVELVVRVFDGLQEVTGECDISVHPAGLRDTVHPAERQDDTGHRVELESGFYDVQVSRRGATGAVTIAWVRRLAVFQYPDDGPYHLEVLNLQPGFGALLIRPAADVTPAERPWRISAFVHDTPHRAGFEPVHGTARHLFVLPAGHYDIVARQGATELEIGDIEVPAGRTRLTLLETHR